jgi:hypothetical protein
VFTLASVLTARTVKASDWLSFSVRTVNVLSTGSPPENCVSV